MRNNLFLGRCPELKTLEWDILNLDYLYPMYTLLIFFGNRSFWDMVEIKSKTGFFLFNLKWRAKFLIYRLLVRDSDWLNFIHCSGYKHKIRLVSIIWKREDQASISISTILKFSVQLTRAVSKNICFINETVGCKLKFQLNLSAKMKISNLQKYP